MALKSENLEHLLKSYEESKYFRLKSGVLRSARTLSRYIGMTLFAAIIGSGYYAADQFKNQSESWVGSSSQKETPYFLLGLKKNQKSNQSMIYFSDKSVLLETEKLVEKANIHWSSIVESRDGNYLLVSLPPKTLDDVLHSTKFSKRYAFSRIKIKDPADENPDIFLLKKDGQLFHNITNSKSHELWPSWTLDDKIHYDILDSAQRKSFVVDKDGKNLLQVQAPYDFAKSVAMNYAFAAALGFGSVLIYGFARRRGRKSEDGILVENKGLATLAFGASTACACLYISNNIINQPNFIIPETSLPFFAFVTAAPSFLLYCSLNQFGKVNRPYLKNVVKFYSFLGMFLTKDTNKKLRLYEGLKPVVKNPEYLDSMFNVDNTFESGKHFRLSEREIDRILAGKNFESSFLEKMLRGSLVYNATQVLSILKPNSLSFKLDVIEENLRFAKIGKAFKGFEELSAPDVSKGKGHIQKELNCLYASFIDSFIKNLPRYCVTANSYELAKASQMLSELIAVQKSDFVSLLNQKGNAQWQKTLDLVLADPQLEKSFKLTGESRNEVLEYAPSEFFNGKLIFKRGKTYNPTQEFKNIAHLKGELPDNIVQAVRMTVHNGYNYLVMRHSGGQNLFKIVEAMDEARKLAVFQKLNTVVNKVLIAGEKLNPIDPCLSNPQYYTKRIEDLFYGMLSRHEGVFLPKNGRAVIQNCFPVVNDELLQGERVLYTDRNIKNVDIRAFSDPILFDFEGNERRCLQLELPNLYCFGSSYLSDNQIEELTEDFVRKREDLTAKVIDRALFGRVLDFAKIVRPLELVAYRLRDYSVNQMGKELDYAKFHLDGAKNAAKYVLKQAYLNPDAKVRLEQIGSFLEDIVLQKS